MGKFLLLLVASASLTAGAVLLNPGLGSGTDSRSLVADQQATVIAEQLSATGIAEASAMLAPLAALPAAITFRGESMGGTYVTTVTPSPPSEVVVRSVGTMDGVGRWGGRHVREVTFKLVPSEGTDAEPPVAPFLGHALVMEKSLTMNSAQRVTSEDPTRNANIHTNGGEYINIQERAGIQGFYYSVKPVPHSWLIPKLVSSFVPNANPDRLPVYQTAPRIEIPVIDLDHHLAAATLLTTTNVSNASGTLDFAQNGVGTAERPALWLIRGDFNTASGKTLRINGHVNIVTQGNVNLQGITLTNENSSVSFYSERDISINGKAQIVGSLAANQNIQLGGNGTVIRGPVSTRGTINFNSDAHIRYRPLSGYMTAPLFSTGSAPSPSGGALTFKAWSSRSA